MKISLPAVLQIATVMALYIPVFNFFAKRRETKRRLAAHPESVPLKAAETVQGMTIRSAELSGRQAEALARQVEALEQKVHDVNDALDAALARAREAEAEAEEAKRDRDRAYDVLHHHGIARPTGATP